MSGAPSQHTFLYKAMKPTGSTTFGLGAAADRANLAATLRERRQLLLLDSWKLPGVSRTPADSVKRLPLADMQALNEQLATLLGRGVPLVEALSVAASVVSKKTEPKMRRLAELVASGASFSNACESVGGFDTMTVGVYRAAERSGDLDAAAGRLATAARRQLAIQGKAITTLIYPAAIVGVGAIMLIIMLAFVVPMIADNVRQLVGERGLPAFSALVFALGEGLRANLLWVAIALGGGIVALVASRRPVIAALASLGRRVPTIARLLIANELARFFSVMAAMTRSGVPLAEALASSTGVLNNPTLRGQLNTLQKHLVEGGVLRDLIAKVDALPLATRQLLIAAERAGDLDQAFDMLAADMAAEVDRRADRLLAALEPAVIVLIALLVGPIILAILQPMLSSLQSVG